MEYEANLTKDSQIIARETVRGSAERVKIIGSREAEKVVGDLFSDILNRLDIEKLFEQAML